MKNKIIFWSITAIVLAILEHFLLFNKRELDIALYAYLIGYLVFLVNDFIFGIKRIEVKVNEGQEEFTNKILDAIK